MDIVRDSLVHVLFEKCFYNESFYAWESCSVSRVPESHLADTSRLAEMSASLALWDTSAALLVLGISRRVHLEFFVS